MTVPGKCSAISDGDWPVFPLVKQRRWEENAILQSWGGGKFHGVKKLEAVCCLSVRFLEVQKEQVLARTSTASCQNKKMEGKNGPDPL